MTFTARLASGVFVFVIGLVCVPSATGRTSSDAVDPNGTPGVANGSVMQSVFEKVGSQRVEFVLIGDSNSNFGTAGWADGVPFGLDQQGFACFATGLFSYNLGGGDFGWLESDIGSDGGTVSQNAPADLMSLLHFSDSVPRTMSPHKYGWMAPGTTAGPSVSRGINIAWDHPMDISGNLLARVAYATFRDDLVGLSSAYQMTPTVRRNSSPWTVLVSELVSTLDRAQVESHVMRTHDLELPAGARSFPLQYRLSNPRATGMAGEVFVTWMRVFNDDRDSGWSVTTLDWAGGANVRHGLDRYLSSGAAMHEHVFAQVRQSALDKGQTPCVVIVLTYGMNDHGDTGLSVDGINADGTLEGYRANLTAFIEQFHFTWRANGWGSDELRFLVVPSHPTDAINESSLIHFRSAAAQVAFARDDTTAANLRAFVSGMEMRENGWLDEGGYHMSSQGYLAMGKLLIETLAHGRCLADFDEDSSVTSDDFIAFLGAFFLGDADVNSDGVTTSDDFFVFLDLFFAGCPGR